MSPGEETAVAYATNTLGFTSDEGEGENTKRAITLISFPPPLSCSSLPPTPFCKHKQWRYSPSRASDETASNAYGAAIRCCSVGGSC